MFSSSQLLSVVVALAVLVSVIELLRRGRLRERHAVWWLLASLIGLALTVFPKLLTSLSSLLGVADPLNLAFFGAIVVLFLVSVQQSTELTRLEERTRTLAERVALLDQRVQQFESGEGPSKPANG